MPFWWTTLPRRNVPLCPVLVVDSKPEVVAVVVVVAEDVVVVEGGKHAHFFVAWSSEEYTMYGFAILILTFNGKVRKYA
jgi:hypothetical protein